MTDYEIERLEEETSFPTTVAEADRAVAAFVGSMRPEMPWVLSDRDVWYANPYYVGPPVPFPDYD